MAANHHVSEELLVRYGAGGLSEGWSLAVATHLALCPDCRRRLADIEAVGGALLEDADPAGADIDSGAFALVMDRIARGEETEMPLLRKSVTESEAIFPEPLRSYIGDVGALKWRRLGAAQQIRLATGDRTTTVRLLKIPGGQPMPVHGHRGLELTLVLTGSFSDEQGTFTRGDIEEADEAIEHQPIATPGMDCICLAVTDAPLRLQGLAAWLQPFLRI